MNPPTLRPQTRMGAVCLTVADLESMRAFYERVIGLETLKSSGSEARLGVDGETLVKLAASPDAPPRPPGTTGLFHLAILVPDRPRLAAALRRVAAAEWRLTGASDHLVSEALYLNDAEGNGVEIYRDRPRAEWGEVSGQIEMATLPLDLGDLVAEPDPGGATGMPPGTVMGHVHLNVAEIPAAEAFYSGLLGFEVTVRGYPGALFVAAGGYHHHLGLNTWMGEGAPAPPAGSLGLERYEIVVPGSEQVSEVGERLGDAGVDVEPGASGDLRFADPFGNGIVLRSV